MTWQFVQGTEYVDSVPEGSEKLPVLVVMSETCIVQTTPNENTVSPLPKIVYTLQMLMTHKIHTA
jgi:hypothetical protein